MDSKETIMSGNLSRDIVMGVQRLGQVIEDACAAETDGVETIERQQALLWCFALLMSHCPSVGRIDSPGVSGSRLQYLLDQLQQIRQQQGTAGDLVKQLEQQLAADPAMQNLRQLTAGADGSWQLVHLFEQLLVSGDAAARRTRGVYFTPPPLVQFIVRSVDHLLRHELQVFEGLTTQQTPLAIVDPACGSGAFLLELLAHLSSQLNSGGSSDADLSLTRWWNNHQLVGIDILPACCAAAELMVERQHLTGSSLSDAAAVAEQAFNWSAHCGNPLREVPFCQTMFADRIPVILGNPPYNNFGQRQGETWIVEQLTAYKLGLHEKKLNLNDDFIKFIRWAQYWIDRAACGIVAYVTNNSYLSGLTHRQMRLSLQTTFDQIYILDLHGSSTRRRSTDSGANDENLFPIRQGVAVSLFVKTGRGDQARRLLHADVRGARSFKMDWLAGHDVNSVSWSELKNGSPFHFFVPRRAASSTGYEQWPQLNEIFVDYVSGVQTKRDSLFVGFTRQELAAKISSFLAAATSGEFSDDVPEWLQKKAVGVSYDAALIRPYMVAPFDLRWVYYDPKLLGRARHRLLRHLDIDNRALVFMRQTTNAGTYDHFLVTNMLVSDRVFYSGHGAPFVAPLFLKQANHQVANLNGVFLQQFATRVSRPFCLSSETPAGHLGPLDVLHWIYAVVHDPAYRQQHAAALHIDFPRIPWPRHAEHFDRVSQAGKKLLNAHLKVFDEFDGVRPPAGSPGGGVTVAAGYPRWRSETLALNSQYRWPNSVPTMVWQARIGGYQVLNRWLKQRKGRLLNEHDLAHLQRMIESLHSLEINAELD